ncbi:MAG: TauD/TfdA family dioxygenase [Pseudomonadota bacterium]
MFAQSVTVNGQQDHDAPFPAVFAPATSDTSLAATCRWIMAEREALLEQLGKSGALLLRGFDVHSDQDFDTLIQAFGLENFAYADSLSNAVRVNRTERVFTANEAPPDVSIFMHHEMAQTPIFPSKLFFYCEHAPEADGETPLCRSDRLLVALEQAVPEFAAKCRELGVRYSNTMPGTDDAQSGQGRSWRSTLKVESREEAEAKLAHLGYSWEWLEDGALRATTPTLPAIRTLVDGRDVFFNQLIAAFRGWADAEKSISFGDHSSIDPDDMHKACQLAEELVFDIPWQTGDVAILDNFLVMHGRRPFSGTRRVLASLVANDGSRLAA